MTIPGRADASARFAGARARHSLAAHPARCESVSAAPPFGRSE